MMLHHGFKSSAHSRYFEKLYGSLAVPFSRQQRISLAKFKWANGRVLLVHACTQMAFGVKRWKAIDHIEMDNTRLRFDVRMAASQYLSLILATETDQKI